MLVKNNLSFSIILGCKLERKERLSDMVIHSHFKYREEPKLEEGYHKIFKIPIILEFNSLDEVSLFNQYF